MREADNNPPDLVEDAHPATAAEQPRGGVLAKTLGLFVAGVLMAGLIATFFVPAAVMLLPLAIAGAVVALIAPIVLLVDYLVHSARRGELEGLSRMDTTPLERDKAHRSQL